MRKNPSDPFTSWTGAGSEAFKLWVSFWPVAPMFGVEWRFADRLKAGAKAAEPVAKTAKPAAAAKTPRKRAEPVASVLPTTPSAPVSDVPADPIEATQAVTEAAATTMTEVASASTAAMLAATDVLSETAARSLTKAPDPEAAAPEETPAAVETAEAETPEATPAEAEAPEATAAPTPPANLLACAPETPDDLKMIKGIGPSLESKLNGLGIYQFDQIAGFSESDLVWVDDNLNAFKGRCFRDDWVGQARTLTS